MTLTLAIVIAAYFSRPTGYRPAGTTHARDGPLDRHPADTGATPQARDR